MRRGKRAVLIASVAAVAVLGGAGIGVASAISAQSPPGYGTTHASDVISLFAEAPRSTEVPRLPLSGLGNGGIEPATVRFLGSLEGSSFWLGLDSTGDICLIAELDADVSGTSCSPPNLVEELGLVTGLAGNEKDADRKAIVMVLLPDSAGLPRDDRWVAVGPNLVVADDDDIEPGEVTVFPRVEGSGDAIRATN